MFLRIIPTALVASLTLKQASDLAGRKELRLQPFDYIPTYGGQWYDRNRYGAITYRTGPREGDPIYQFTQMLKNRELWGVNGEPATWQVPGTEFGVIANGYEAAFVRALGHYLEFARDNLELRPPLRIIGGFTRIEDYRMEAPRGQRFRGLEKYRGRAVEPEIIFESVVQNWETPTEKVLMPFFEDMWHSFGFDERPDVPT